MDKKKELVFDPQMIANYRELAGNMIIGDEIVRRKLNESTTIDYQTKILLRFIAHTSLHTCSHLCRLSAINMSLLNDMEQVIDDLPDQLYYVKIKFRNLVKSTKEELNYQRLAERIPDTSFECEGWPWAERGAKTDSFWCSSKREHDVSGKTPATSGFLPVKPRLVGGFAHN